MGVGKILLLAGTLQTAQVNFLFFYFAYLAFDSITIFRMHELIIDVHVRILDYISYRLPDMYNDISKEYVKMFKELANYSNKKVKLESFVPNASEDIKKHLDLTQIFVEIETVEEYLNILKHVLKFIEFVLIKNLNLHKLNGVVYESLEYMLKLLKVSSIDAKLLVFELYANLLKSAQLTEQRFDYDLISNMDLFPQYLEMQLYEIYDRKVNVTEENIAIFNMILDVFLKNSRNIPHKEDGLVRISIFLLNQIENSFITNSLINDTFEILSLESRVLNQIPSIDVEFIAKYPNAIKMFKKEIVNEILHYVAQLNSKQVIEIHVYNKDISKTFFKLHELTYSALQQRVCSNNSCSFKAILSILQNLLDATMDIKIKLQHFKLKKCWTTEYVLTFFDDDAFLNALLMYLNSHMDMCRTKVDMERFLKLISYLPILFYNKDLDVLLHILIYPFLKRIHLNMAIATTNMNLRQNLKVFSTHLVFTENLSVQYTCVFIRIIASGLVDFLGNVNDIKSIFFKFFHYCVEENNVGAQKIVSLFKHR